MHPESHAGWAAQIAAKFHKVHEPVVLDRAEARDPKTGRSVYRFKVASTALANGPAHLVFLNEQGEALEVTDELATLFERPRIVQNLTFEIGDLALQYRPLDGGAECLVAGVVALSLNQVQYRLTEPNPILRIAHSPALLSDLTI